MHMKQIGTKQYPCINTSDLASNANVVGYILHFGGKTPLSNCQIRSMNAFVRFIISEYIYIEKRNIYVGVLSIRLIYSILTALIVFFLLTGTFLLTDVMKTHIENMNVEKRDETNVLFNAYTNMIVKGKSKLPLHNDRSNSVNLIYEIADASDKVLYTTKPIAPGQSIEWNMSDALKKGDNLLNIKITAYSIRTNQEVDEFDYAITITME